MTESPSLRAASFTGQNANTDATLYDFMHREDGIQGRWTSPDPLGPVAFNLADPQPLDRYAYVRNTPTNLIDPLGLFVNSCPGIVINAFCYPMPPPSANWASGEGSIPYAPLVDVPGMKPGGVFPHVGAQPQGQACSQHGFGFGVSGGGNADLGAGFTGATATGSVGGGLFYSGQSGASGGAFEEGGAAAYFLNHVAGAPAQSRQPLSFLGFIGGGLSAFITNAGSAQQLAGPFTTYSVNVGFGPFKFTAQFAHSNRTYVLSFGPPYTGAGLGASVSWVTTNTAVLGSTCGSGG